MSIGQNLTLSSMTGSSDVRKIFLPLYSQTQPAKVKTSRADVIWVHSFQDNFLRYVFQYEDYMLLITSYLLSLLVFDPEATDVSLKKITLLLVGCVLVSVTIIDMMYFLRVLPDSPPTGNKTSSLFLRTAWLLADWRHL